MSGEADPEKGIDVVVVPVEFEDSLRRINNVAEQWSLLSPTPIFSRPPAEMESGVISLLRIFVAWPLLLTLTSSNGNALPLY